MKGITNFFRQMIKSLHRYLIWANRGFNPVYFLFGWRL